MRKGGEAPLAGGADGTSRASGVGWRGTCVGVGGTVPAPAFPPGKRERGIRFLAAAGDLISAEADVCSSLAHPRPRRLASLTLYGPAANQSFPKFAGVIHLRRASIRTLNDLHTGCMLEFDLKPRSVTTVTDLGCWVLPSLSRSLSDLASISSHPNKGCG